MMTIGRVSFISIRIIKPKIFCIFFTEKLCSCPLNCDTKISKEQRKLLYEHFRDKFSHSQQNTYIQRHLKIKSQGLEDKAKRITCIYLVPTIGSAKESNRRKYLVFELVIGFKFQNIADKNSLMNITRQKSNQRLLQKIKCTNIRISNE